MGRHQRAEKPEGLTRSVSDPCIQAALLRLHGVMDLESLWQASIGLLQAAMPGRYYFMGLPSIGTMPVVLRTTAPVADEPGYWARLHAVAPLEKVIANNRGRKLGRLSDDVPFLLLRLSPFYREFMKPQGWRYCVGLFFWDGDAFLGHFAQNRAASQGDYTDEELALLLELHPHLETAIRRVLLLDRERAARFSIEESIQRSPLPTAVLDWDLKPMFHNEAAAEASAVWRLGPEAARSLKPHFEMPADLARECKALGTSWEEAVLADRRERSRARIFPHATFAGCQAQICLLIKDDAQFTKPHFLVQWSLLGLANGPDCAVQMLARLTPAERQVAMLAAQGLENQVIASDLAVSCSTVRTHLRNIFGKLRITSRSRLAALQWLDGMRK